MRRKSLSEILTEFTNIHGDRYKYDKFMYINTHTPSIITCRLHGDFTQTPSKHLIGRGCRTCGNVYTPDEILIKLTKIHGDLYKFNLSGYVNTNSYISYECPHGIKNIQTRSALSGQGCIYCKGGKWHSYDLCKILTEIHGNKYIYDDNFHENGDILRVKCRTHNEYFNVKKYLHLTGQGCRKCSKRKKYDTELFISEISKFDTKSLRHCDLSKLIYIDHSNNIEVICLEHGAFDTKPYYLLGGHGCVKCGWSKKYTVDEYVQKCNEQHREIDHTLTVYNGVENKIIATCKTHGNFEQKAGSYLIGKGCPYCYVSNSESRGEKTIRYFLMDNNILFKQEYRYMKFRFDFYLPKYNIFIEFNGKQHYEPIDFFGGIKTFDRQVARDIEKDKIFEINKHMHLLKISYLEYDDINKIIKKFIESHEN